MARIDVVDEIVVTDETGARVTNGAAVAAFVAAGVGTFAIGLIVILNEAGLLSVPAVYAPAGGVTGRTTLGVVVWLVAWAVLHFRWKGRDVDAGRPYAITLVLIALGVLFTLPPVWALLP